MPTRKRFTDDSFQKEPWFRALCSALLSCKTEADMANLLRDVGTLSELQAWSERLEVAKHLVRGLSYREVARLTGASTTTVTRVARFIENGMGGYRAYFHAHRHHRMPTRVRSVPTQDVGSQAPESSSVLQKYLQKKESSNRDDSPLSEGENSQI